MSTAIGSSNKIRRIVSIRQMIQRWRKKARVTASNRPAPSDVPAGHIAIAVGSSSRRFIIRATFLNHPIFRNLLQKAEEEYGFINQGPLAIPCDELVFENLLRVVAQSESGNSGRFLTRCHVDSRRNLRESRLLLFGYADKSVC